MAAVVQEEFVRSLNRHAGTTNLEAVGAANAWAGTTGLGLVAALNSVVTASHPAAVTNPSLMKDLNGICQALAGAPGAGLEAQGALASF
jgi:hypothetical protein